MRNSTRSLAVIASLMALHTLGAAGQSVGPPPPALLVTLACDSSRVTALLGDQLRKAGFPVEGRNRTRYTSPAPSPQNAVAGELPIILGVELVPVDRRHTVLMLWGQQRDSAGGQWYVTFDHAQLPDGGRGWSTLVALGERLRAGIHCASASK